MKLDLLVLVIASVLNTFLGLVVLLRNPRKLLNITFAGFAGTVVLWTACNYLADNAVAHNLFYTRITVLFGSLIPASLVALSLIFPQRLKISNKMAKALVVATALNGILCMTSLYVSSVKKVPGGVELEVGGPYVLFMVYMLAFVGLAIFYFTKQLRRAERLAKSQVRLFMLGFIVYTTLAIASNVILPLLVDNWASSKYGPIFTVPFVGITSYAMIKHRLFDIRSLVARIVAYLLTVGIVVALYALLLTLVITRVVQFGGDLTMVQLLALAVPTIISGLTFGGIKHAVDRLTAQVFFHNPYETRDVLDALSDKLMAENDIEKLMRDSARVLAGALTPNAMRVVVLEGKTVYKEFSAGGTHHEDITPYIDIVTQRKRQVYMRDASIGAETQALMDRNGHDILLKLSTKDEPIGFICLGNKETGSIYTMQDIELLQVAAKNLSVALENAKKYEQIQHFAETLKAEVARATTHLRQANQRLKTLDQLKDDFISMASHQFRTPAGSIRQALKMMRDPDMKEKERAELMHLAEADSEELVTLVGTMLNISRLQAGRFVIDRSTTDLVYLSNKVMEMTNVLAERKKVSVTLHTAEEKLPIEVDESKIREAMTNYVENAIKYSPAGSKINVELRIEDGKIHFEVADQGMGVPEEDRKHLFGRFYRAQNARKFQPDGNGIGLYVVKNIATGHGGEAYYKPLETGSLFGFWIPLDQPKKA